jgi:hypothetical protein
MLYVQYIENIESAFIQLHDGYFIQLLYFREGKAKQSAWRFPFHKPINPRTFRNHHHDIH